MTRVAAAAAVPAFVLGAAGPSAASGTPDDHWDEAFPGGSVMWNDYNTDNPAEDYDNIKIDDRDNDGYSIRLIATNQSTGYTDSEHAYRGETKELDVGNVRKGDRVTFHLCLYDDGVEGDCTKNYWYSE